MPSFIYQLYQYPLMWRQSHDEIQSGVCTLLWNNTMCLDVQVMWQFLTNQRALFLSGVIITPIWNYFMRLAHMFIGVEFVTFINRESERDFNWPILEGVDLF